MYSAKVGRAQLVTVAPGDLFAPYSRIQKSSSPDAVMGGRRASPPQQLALDLTRRRLGEFGHEFNKARGGKPREQRIWAKQFQIPCRP